MIDMGDNAEIADLLHMLQLLKGAAEGLFPACERRVYGLKKQGPFRHCLYKKTPVLCGSHLPGEGSLFWLGPERKVVFFVGLSPKETIGFRPSTQPKTSAYEKPLS
jgi:hypothetical protein